MTTENTQPAATRAAGPTKITLGETEYTIERPSGRKASSALALIRAVSKATPGIQKSMARFKREYEAENVVELDRVQARLAYPPRPLVDENGAPVLDAQGAPTMIASRVEALSEEDWERAGHILKRPISPTTQETIFAVFDEALELAEDHVYRLLALFLMSNADVARYRKADELPDRLEELADTLLDDTPAEQIMELVVVCGEVVEGQFSRKAAELGARMGNALKLIGINPPPTSPAMTTETTSSPSPSTPSSDGPTTSTPSSSTDTPAPTDGPPTTPSISPGPDSPPSPSSPSATTSESSKPASSPEPSVMAT